MRCWRLPLVALWTLCFGIGPAHGQETALDRYVAAPDPSFAWKLITTITGEGQTTYVLEMTSQQWRTAAEIDRPVWKHWLTIVKPDAAHGKTGFLFIGGGDNGDPAPEAASPRAVALALGANSVVAELGMVPNQPLRFNDSPDAARVEDDLVAYSRVKFMATGDETWLVRLAMVKSGVRALDAIQQFLASDAGGRTELKEFVVAGASKRGWTTWLVGIVDPRVVAIVPLVIDALNSEAITRHHYEAYGFFSESLNDYVRHKLFPQKIGTPEYRAVLTIEDPYQYRHRARLRLPKFVVNAAGDEFFLPDNSRFYFAELPQEKYLRYVPNTKHDLQGSDALASVQAFYESVLHNRRRPQFRWELPDAGGIVVRTEDQPLEVNLWQATNPNARDFRLDVIGKAFSSSPLAAMDDGAYRAELAPPDKGFSAYFVELVFDSGGSHPFKFTTDVRVVPDRLPYRFDDALRQAK